MAKFKIADWLSAGMLAVTLFTAAATVLIAVGSYKERFRVLEETTRQMPKAIDDIHKLTVKTDSMQTRIAVMVSELATIKRKKPLPKN